MPINKDALNRFRIIDEMLADPMGSYSTDDILRKVNTKLNVEQREVSIRQIQKDLKDGIQQQFGKEIIRTTGYGGKRVVRYADQSKPIFNKQLTNDEAEILHESLKVLGQFDGLDNLRWLDTLRRKLDEVLCDNKLPIISFSKNERLLIKDGLLGKLFTAISRRQTIKIIYTPFGKNTQERLIYPYQLKQYNDRWYILGTPVGNDDYPYNPERIDNLALDRIEDFEIPDQNDFPFVESPLDLITRFDEVVGVTFYDKEDIQEITFAVRPNAVPFMETKPLHISQFCFPETEQRCYRTKYPQFAKWTFYSIECRYNYELFALISSFQDQIVIINPETIVREIKNKLSSLISLYNL